MKDSDSLSAHKAIRGLLSREWADIEKSSFPHFLVKRYFIQGFSDEFPSNIKVDSLMAGLASCGSIISEDASPSDLTDKKVEHALKRAYSAANFAIRAGAYSTYAVQSLLRDFRALAEEIQNGEESTSRLLLMEQQVRLLSDVSFDSLSAAISGATIFH